MNSGRVDYVAHLIDLEQPYDEAARRTYDVAGLVSFALTMRGSGYWQDLAMGWVEAGVRFDGLRSDLAELENDRSKSQQLRHRARRVRKQLG